MTGSLLPNSVNMTYVEEVPKLIDSRVQVKELTQIEESHHHADRIQRTLSRSALHGAEYLLEKVCHGKNEPKTK